MRPFLVAGVALAAASFFGCQNLWTSTPSSGSTPAPEPRPVFAASVKVYMQDEAQHEIFVGEFDRASCKRGFPEQWSFYFTSLVGQHRFDVDFKALTEPKPEPDPLVVKTAQQRYHLKMDALPPKLAARKLCEESKESDSIRFASDASERDELTAVLNLVAPDCQFGYDGDKGLACKLKHPSSNELMGQLESLKKNMTTKWNHQPYLLIRRLTLATQMLEAMRKGRQADWKKVCRILRHSLPNELPLSFRSKLWQEKVCSENEAEEEAVLIGLDQAVRELQTLSRRIEDASLVGLFTLAVPRDQVASKDYWVSLQPVEVPLVMSEIPPQTMSCVWHPLFFEQPEQQLVAIDLAQVPHSEKSFCAPAPSLARAKREADIYVRSSIASEMEFQISNGQSKKLRLPTGDYRYTVSQFTGPFAEEMTSTQEIAPLSTGHISWKSARPHLIIRSW